MDQLNQQFVQNCLSSNQEYKQNKPIKQAVSNNQLNVFPMICLVIHDTLKQQSQSSPMSKLLAFRLSKDLLDILNKEFAHIYSEQTLPVIVQYASFQKPSTDPNRGATFFKAMPEKEEKQIGLSIVRLALDCARAWAMIYPAFQKNQPSQFLITYSNLVKDNVNFPDWAYYKPEFIQQHADPDFQRLYDQLQHQPEKLAAGGHQQGITPTPGGPTPGGQNVNQEAKDLLAKKKRLYEEIGQKCNQVPIPQYKFEQFAHFSDEIAILSAQVEEIVNQLIDAGEEDFATEVMDELDGLFNTIQDFDNLKNQGNYQQFKTKYGNAQQQQQQQQQFIDEQKAKEEHLRQEQEREHQKMLQIQKQQEQEREHQRQLEIQRQQEQEREHQRQLEHQRLQEQEREREHQRQLEIERQQELEREHQRQLEQQRIQEQERERQRQLEIHRKQEEEKERERQRQRQQEIEQQQQQQFQFQQNQQQGQIEESININQYQPPSQSNINSGRGKIFDQNNAMNNNIVNQYESLVMGQGQQSISNSRVQAKQYQSQYISKKPISHSSVDKRIPQTSKIKGDTVDPIMEISVINPNANNSERVKELLKQIDDLQRENMDLKEQLTREKENSERLHQIISQQHGNGSQNDQALIEEFKRELQQARSDAQGYRLKCDQLENQKKQLEYQLNQFKSQLDDTRHQHEVQKIQLSDNHDQQLQNMQQQNQLHIVEKNKLKQELEKLRQNHGTAQEYQDKHNQAQQKIEALMREIETHKRDKLKLQQDKQSELENSKYQAIEYENITQSHKDQMKSYQMKLDTLNKDYNALIEKHKQQNEQTLEQVIEAKKESNQKQAQIDKLQLEMNDLETDYKSLQMNYKALETERNQLQISLQQTQNQMNEFIQMYQNVSKTAENKSTALYQTKLKQTLDEIDNQKMKHQYELEDLNTKATAQIAQLMSDKESLQKEIENMQQQLQQQTFQQQSQQKPNEVMAMNQQLEQANKSFQFSVQQQESQQNLKKSMVCPIPNFRHFPKSNFFQLLKKLPKNQSISSECLDIIFPYQNPADYFENKATKQRKGRVINFNVAHLQELSHLNQLNNNLFKQRCLGSAGLIFYEQDLQFGLLHYTQQSQGKSYYTYGLYIQSLSQQQINVALEFLDYENFPQFWSSQITFNKLLVDDEQQVIELLVGQPKKPMQVLSIQVKQQNNHPFQFQIPNHICQTIVYSPIKRQEYNNKWKALIQNMIRTELLELNLDVFINVSNFQQMIPKLTILNHHKTQDFEMGIDELKLGGFGCFMELLFYIKFEILPNDQICIYLTYDNKYLKSKSIFEQILQGYAFILSQAK